MEQNECDPTQPTASATDSADYLTTQTNTSTVRPPSQFAPYPSCIFDHDMRYRRPTLNDNLYARGIFKGRINEDAVEYVAYVERYATYKHLNERDIAR